MDELLVFRPLPVFAVFVCLSTMVIATASNGRITYFLDTSNDAVAVKLGDTCYVTKVSPAISASLHQPYELEKFERHMVELVALHQGQHANLTLRDLVGMSGIIAQGCLTAIDIYRIPDESHTLLITPDKNQRDCHDLSKDGAIKSGVYKVYPSGVTDGVDVYCDMDTDGGGWLVFQKRFDGFVKFNELWSAYKTGFGHVTGEFWLGNSPLHSILKQGKYKLRIDMEDAAGTKKYAMYDEFSIGDESTRFKLTVSGYHGDAGDELSRHNLMAFSTSDKDNDVSPTRNCAMEYQSGWWFIGCQLCDLNGTYKKAAYGHGISWSGFSFTLKKAEMKIRPAL